MPAPWLTTALKVIPWSVLWAQAPAIIDASRKLWVRARESKSVTATPERPVDAGGIDVRLAALESNEKSQAALLEQIAAQIEGLTLGLEVIAARVRLALGLSAAALVIAGSLALWVLLR